jgi:hypothetical protein
LCRNPLLCVSCRDARQFIAGAQRRRFGQQGFQIVETINGLSKRVPIFAHEHLQGAHVLRERLLWRENKIFASVQGEPGNPEEEPNTRAHYAQAVIGIEH